MKPFVEMQNKRYDVSGCYRLKKAERITIPIKGKITRVKYVPPHTKVVIDKKEEAKARKERANQPSFLKHLKR